MLPTLRRNIRSDVSKNKALRDILSPTAKALEIISVEELEYQVYNTKTIAIIEENGITEERVLIYNRLALNELLSEAVISGSTIEQIINNLNEQGFDFTVDDLELVSGQVKAKVTSLGYYNEEIVDPVDPVDAIDYALITIPDLFISLTINGTVIQGVTENDGYTTDLEETLKSHGIFPINTNDNYGCNNLYRLQAMTETELNIVLVTTDGSDDGDMGVSYLPGQPNTTIVGTDIYNNFGWDNSADIYKSISFTLGPRKSLTQDQINNLDKIFIQNEFVLDNRANAYGHQNIRMEIYFNDQLVFNGTLENSTKCVIADKAINDWLISTNSPFHSNLAQWLNAPYLSFTNIPAEQWLKVTLVAIYTGPTVPITVNDGVLSHFDNAGLVTHGVDRKTAEFYIFDPFNF